MRQMIVTLVTSLALLAACQGEPEVVEPDSTGSPSAEQAPEMPEQAREDSQEGAAAFVEHWVEVFNHAARTGDAQPLKKLGPECRPCNDYADGLEKNALEGDVPTGDLWDFEDLLINEAPDKSIDIQLRVTADYGDGPEVHRVGYILRRADPYVVTDLYLIEED